MTGEVGTGKTMMLRCLFELWETEQIPFAYFIGPRLSTIDFLSYITLELGITVAEPSKGNLLRALYGFLLAQFERGLTTILVIDEAHQIPRRVLEEIRLLTNFETAQQKLVQILLVGQPELDAKLDSPDLRSLKQRIAARCRLEPLRKQDVTDYIYRRLEIAGATPAVAAAIFPAETISSVFRYSHGIPRLVNSICDQALNAACAQKTHVVSVAIIENIAAHFRLNSEKPKQSEKPAPRPAPVETQLPVSWSRAVSSGFNLQSLKPAEEFPGLQKRDLEGAPPAHASMLSEADISAVINDVQEVRPHEFIAALESLPVPLDVPEPQIVERQVVERQAFEPVVAPVVEVLQPRAFHAVAPPVAMPDLAQVAASLPAPGPAPTPVVPPAVPPVGLIDARVRPVPAKPAAAIAGTSQMPAQPSASRSPFHYEPVERDRFSLQKLMRGLLRSSFRLSIVIGAAVLVAVGLAAGVSVARHPKAAAAMVHAPSAGNAGASPTASLRPVAAAAGIIEDSSSSPNSSNLVPVPVAPSSGIGVLPHSGGADPPALRSRTAVSKLSQPRLKSSRLPVSSEPPSIVPSQTGDLDFAKTLPEISAPGSPTRGAVTGGHLQKPRLLSSPAPIYPQRARLGNVQGVVVIDAFVDETGKVTEMKIVSGPPLLIQAALDALRTWKYDPARLNGEPIPMHTQVSLDFNLH